MILQLGADWDVESKDANAKSKSLAVKPKCIFGLERWIAGAYHLSHVELKWHC